MNETLDVLPAAASWVDTHEETRRKLQAVAGDVRELASAEGASEELLAMLADLGPVFSGFARFLASRPDAIPAGLRADLARVPDRVAPAPFAEIRDIVETGWRRAIDSVCWTFEERPTDTRFPTQSHRAWLTPTDAVIVTCVPPSFEDRLERELQLLPMLSGALSAAMGGPDAFTRMTTAYRAHTRQLLELDADAVASEALVADARRFPALLARRPHRGLCANRVAVWDDVAGVPRDTPGFDVREAGASACRAWLRQALLGRAFPEEAAPADFIDAGRRQVALGGRMFRSLPTETQLTIQGYLVAVAAHDPDLAIKYLKRELVSGRGADATGFRRRMRHARSVDVDAAGGSELMAQLLLHWRLAVEHGFQPTARLVSFYRGCLAAVSAATEIGAEPDVLRDSLEALQIRLAAFQIEAATGVSPSTARSVREAGWRLVASLAAGPLAADRHSEPARGSAAAITALALVLATIGFVAPALIASGVPWAEPVGASAFAAVGTVVLVLVLNGRRNS